MHSLHFSALTIAGAVLLVLSFGLLLIPHRKDFHLVPARCRNRTGFLAVSSSVSASAVSSLRRGSGAVDEEGRALREEDENASLRDDTPTQHL